MLNRRKIEDVQTATAPALSADEQLRLLDQQARALAAKREALQRKADEDRVAEQRREIRNRIEATRQTVSAKLSRKRAVERQLDEALDLVQRLAAEAAQSTDEVAGLIENSIITIKGLGANDEEVDRLRASLASAAPSSRSAYAQFKSNRRRWTEVYELDLRLAGNLERYAAATRLIVVAEKVTPN